MATDLSKQAHQVVYIIDDDDEFRRSLKTLLVTAEFQVREFSSAEEYLETSDHDDCGCIILDLRMPGMGGKALQQKLFENGNQTPIIIVTAYASVPVAVDAMRQGAITVLEKPFDPPVLLDAVANSLKKQPRTKPLNWQEVTAKYALSPRQEEIAKLICDSLSNEQIAEHLGITGNTVRMHIKLLYEKLGVKDRVGVAMRLLQR